MKSNYDFSKGKQGKKAKEVKTSKTFRLDTDVLEWLEEQGEKEGIGYQTFLNWFLRKAMLSESSIEDRISKLEKTVYKKRIG
ncbi:MAG: CopG family transcriptional regulator [Bdellovibrionaceae bacterium]|nr:CopG family transcriptional regulator [Pseudobdellovibrionaceae bacterium]|tara:strand:+ start:249 stop:494 length:246 start_codon:yes stop_codon:yes gene_type:complete